MSSKYTSVSKTYGGKSANNHQTILHGSYTAPKYNNQLKNPLIHGSSSGMGHYEFSLAYPQYSGNCDTTQVVNCSGLK